MLPHTESILSSNNIAGIVSIGAVWGTELMSLLVEKSLQHSFDLVIMADVLYHCEDFEELIASIRACCKHGTMIYISFEQRRKQLDIFFQKVEELSVLVESLKYVIENSVTGREVTFFILKYKLL